MLRLLFIPPQSWRRALVEDVDTVQKKAHVFYIDYGNNENIPFSCIKVLPKDNELLFPPCVSSISLTVDESLLNEWLQNECNLRLRVTVLITVCCVQ